MRAGEGAANSQSHPTVVLLVGGLGFRVRHLASDELAELRHAVLLGAAHQDGLRLAHLLVVARPRLDDGVLQRARVRERHVPRVGRLVHGVQVQGGVQLGQAAGQEHDARGLGGHAGVEHAQGGLRHLLGGVALGAVRAGANLRGGGWRVEGLRVMRG